MVETRNQTRLREQQSKQMEEQNSLRSEILDLKKMMEPRVQSTISLNKQMEDTQRLANLESPWPLIFSHGSSNVHSQRSSSSMSEALTTYPTLTQPPDPHDHKINLTFNTSRNKLSPLKYSYDEIDDRMTNGLCIFCEEADIPGHQLKHKKLRIVMIECEDELVDDNELEIGFKLEAMETNVSAQEITSSCANDMTTTEAIQGEESSPKSESRPNHLIKALPSPEVFISGLEQVRNSELQPYNDSSLINFLEGCDIDSFFGPLIPLRDGSNEKQVIHLMNDGLLMTENGFYDGLFSNFSLLNRMWEPGGILVDQVHGNVSEEFYSEDKALQLMQIGNRNSSKRVAKELTCVVARKIQIQGLQTKLLVNLTPKSYQLLIFYECLEGHITSRVSELFARSKWEICEDAYSSIKGVRAEKVLRKRPHDPGRFSKHNQNAEQGKLVWWRFLQKLIKWNHARECDFRIYEQGGGSSEKDIVIREVHDIISDIGQVINYLLRKRFKGSITDLSNEEVATCDYMCGGLCLCVKLPSGFKDLLILFLAHVMRSKNERRLKVKLIAIHEIFKRLCHVLISSLECMVNNTLLSHIGFLRFVNDVISYDDGALMIELLFILPWRNLIWEPGGNSVGLIHRDMLEEFYSDDEALKLKERVHKIMEAYSSQYEGLVGVATKKKLRSTEDGFKKDKNRDMETSRVYSGMKLNGDASDFSITFKAKRNVVLQRHGAYVPRVVKPIKRRDTIIVHHTPFQGAGMVKFSMEQFEKRLVIVITYNRFHSPRPPDQYATRRKLL